MTAAEAVETSVANSLSQDYSNLDDLLSLTGSTKYLLVDIVNHTFDKYLHVKRELANTKWLWKMLKKISTYFISCELLARLFDNCCCEFA